jgi:DNA-binding ferritin-like protein
MTQYNLTEIIEQNTELRGRVAELEEQISNLSREVRVTRNLAEEEADPDFFRSALDAISADLESMLDDF